MTTITIPPENAVTPTFHAWTDDKESVGRTMGEALDALTAQLPEDDLPTVIIVKRNKPDQFFDARQHQRLGELMEKLRFARNQETELPPAEQRELEELVNAELRGAIKRTDAMFSGLPR